MTDWTRRGLLLYPLDAVPAEIAGAIAQAYVDTVALETYANELLMWEKAAQHSADYGASTTHRSIHTALTPELAEAITAQLAGISGGLWYLLDADTDALISTNDPARLGGDTVTHGLDWEAGMAVSVGEVVRYNGQLMTCLQAHTTQADWTPDITPALWKRYIAPGEVVAWFQPQGAHDAWPLGARVEYDGQVWVSTIPANVYAPGVTGWTVEGAEEPTEAWAYPVAYTGDNTAGAGNGDIVTYNGTTYRCLQSHTSQAGWTPPVVPALWAVVA